METAAAETSDAKGTALEQLVADMFAGVEGVTPSGNNVVAFHGQAEIDLAFWNDGAPRGLLREAFGWCLLFECKNWDAPVDVQAINHFVTKLRERGLNLGILVAANGITGSPQEITNGQFAIASALHSGIRVIVLTIADLNAVEDDQGLVAALRQKLMQLMLTESAA